MAKTTKKGGDDGGLGPEDKHLWDHVAKEIAPLSSDKKRNAAPAPVSVEPTPKKAQRPKEAPKAPLDTKTDTAPSFQVDARTDSKLRRGKIPIEARIDLHGYTQDQAHTALNRFLTKCYANDMRCVLVITGKGIKNLGDDHDKPVRGVLKKMLPVWISMSPLKSIVLKYHPAQIKDGGEGAFYIYLKRRR